MEENNKVYCSYSECGNEIDLRLREYVLDDKEEHYFCKPGCRAMWELEKSSCYLELHERGIEQIVTKYKIINL